MESERPLSPFVNGDDEKLDRKIPGFPAQIPDNDLEEKARRFCGYIEGIFARSQWRLPNFLMKEAKARFARRLCLSADHVERVSRALMRRTDKFSFIRTRLGRSFHILIIPRHRSEQISTEEVRRRLVRGIGNYVAKSGVVRVDRRFLAGFHRRYGLLPEQIFAAWASIKFVPNCVCRWRGAGKKKFLNVRIDRSAGQVSSRQSAGRISSLREKLSENSGYAGSEPEGSSGSLRSPTGRGGGGSARNVVSPGGTLRDTLRPAIRSDGQDFQSQSGRPPWRANTLEPAENDRAIDRLFSGRAPLQIGNRLGSPCKLRGKVNFITFQILRRMHETADRVRFWPTTARNFVGAAILAGFLDSEICAAYRIGLDETQASARRDFERGEEQRDRTGIGPTAAEYLREPSQAVNRAWLRLRTDERSDAQRWAAIFDGSAKPQREFEKGAGGGKIEKPPAPPGAAREIEKPAIATRVETGAAAAWREKKKEQATIETHLAARGLTLAALLKLPRPEQAAFIREALAAQRRGRGNSQNGEFVNE